VGLSVTVPVSRCWTIRVDGTLRFAGTPFYINPDCRKRLLQGACRLGAQPGLVFILAWQTHIHAHIMRIGGTQ